MRLPTKLLPASQILSIPHYPTRLRFHTKPTRFAASLQQLDVKRLTATQLARTGALNGTQKTSSKQPKSFAELLERGDVLAAVAEAGFAAPTEIQVGSCQLTSGNIVAFVLTGGQDCPEEY